MWKNTYESIAAMALFISAANAQHRFSAGQYRDAVAAGLRAVLRNVIGNINPPLSRRGTDPAQAQSTRRQAQAKHKAQSTKHQRQCTQLRCATNFPA
jgi:hypothetical protein